MLRSRRIFGNIYGAYFGKYNVVRDGDGDVVKKRVMLMTDDDGLRWFGRYLCIHFPQVLAEESDFFSV